MNTGVVIATSLILSAVASLATAQVRAVRQANDRGVILLFGPALAQEPPAGVNAEQLRLFDLTAERAIPVILAADCAEGVSRVQRICVVPREGRLEPDHIFYLWLLARLELANGGHLDTISEYVPPDGGTVREPVSGDNIVSAESNIELDPSHTYDTRIRVDGRDIAILNDPPGAVAPCYRRGRLGFACEVDHRFAPREVVAMDVSDVTTGERYVLAPATVDRQPWKPSESRFMASGSVGGKGGDRVGVFTAAVRQLPLGTWGARSDDFTVTFGVNGELHWAAGQSETNRVWGGPFIGLFAGRLPVLTYVEADIGPVWEQDTGGQIQNALMDLRVGLGLPSFLGGFAYRGATIDFLPWVGATAGRNVQRVDSIAIESAEIGRLKAGMGLVLTTPQIAGFGQRRVSASLDLQRLWISADEPDGEQNVRHSHGAVVASASLQLSDYFGVGISFRDGRFPPLFAVERAWELGLTLSR